MSSSICVHLTSHEQTKIAIIHYTKHTFFFQVKFSFYGTDYHYHYVTGNLIISSCKTMSNRELLEIKESNAIIRQKKIYFVIQNDKEAIVWDLLMSYLH